MVVEPCAGIRGVPVHEPVLVRHRGYHAVIHTLEYKDGYHKSKVGRDLNADVTDGLLGVCE